MCVCIRTLLLYYMYISITWDCNRDQIYTMSAQKEGDHLSLMRQAVMERSLPSAHCGVVFVVGNHMETTFTRPVAAAGSMKVS